MKIQFEKDEIKTLIQKELERSGTAVLESKCPEAYAIMRSQIEEGVKKVTSNKESLEAVAAKIIHSVVFRIAQTIEEQQKRDKEKDLKAVITDSPMTFGAN